MRVRFGGDLRSDVVEHSLEPYLQRLQGKSEVRVVCMDVATVYRPSFASTSPMR